VLGGVGGDGAEGFEVGPGVEPLVHGGGVLALPAVEAEGGVGASAEEEAEDVVPLLGALLDDDEEALELGEGAVFAFDGLLELAEEWSGERLFAEDADAFAEDNGFGGEEFGGRELGEGAGAEGAADEGLEGEEQRDVAGEEG